MAKSGTDRTRRRVVLVVVLLAAALAAWWALGGDLRRTASAGTAYGARVACSCRYVAGRPLADCAKDKLAGMELVRLSEDEATRTVTASIPLVASDSASYRKGYGCLLQPWGT